MHRFLDWLDEAAGGLIRIAYLVWGVVAVAAYFGDGTVPPAISDTLAALAPWTLAFAVETHTYLTARRVRSAWQDMQATSDDPRPRRALKVNLGILAGLLAFSMLNQLQYLAQTWTPPHTALSLPGPLAYIVRAVVVPAAFMAAAFLAPIGASLATQIQGEAHRFAAATFKVARRQWKTRLKEMERGREDVTGALVQLVEDPSERRVIETIHAAMYPVFEHNVAPERTQLERPIDGGLTLLPPAPQARANRSNTKRRRTESAEKRVRTAWVPGMTVSQLAQTAGIGRSAASKWRRILTAEADAQTAEGEAQHA